jgi:hypothetical protein
MPKFPPLAAGKKDESQSVAAWSRTAKPSLTFDRRQPYDNIGWTVDARSFAAGGVERERSLR